MNAENRRLLLTSALGSAIALALCGMGIWLFRYSWFIKVASNAFVSWFVTFVAIAAFFGTPILFILLVWRWEPQMKSLQSVLIRWVCATVGGMLGWFLTIFVITGFTLQFISFYGQSLSQFGTYVTVGGGAAIVGFLDWLFIRRHWKKKELTPRS